MLAMVRFLVRNVVLHGVGRRRAYGKRRVAFLPSKISIEILLHLVRRIFLKISHHICKAMHRAQTSHQVDVIFYATNNLRDAVHAPDDSTQVGMQSRSPFGTDERPSFLGRENNVVMQTEES